MIRVGKLLRRLARAVCRKRRAPTPSRTLTKTETDHFRRRMAEHGVDDQTPDPSTKWERQ
jgi:hypothetical protein